MFLSIRDFTVKWVGYKNLFDGLRDLGINSFELYVSRELKPDAYVDMGHKTLLGLDVSSREYRVQLRRLLKDEGFTVSAILIENDFSRPDMDAEIKYVVDACRVAGDLGVPVVRINAMMRELPGYTIEEYVERMVKAVSPCLETCSDLGVSLAMENHGVIGNRDEFIEKLIDEIGSEYFGLTLDTGNFYWYGYPLSRVYEIIEKYAHLVKHTHVKNASVPKNLREAQRKPGEVKMMPLYEGDIDLKKVIKTLKSKGYDYDINIEDESLGAYKDPLTILKNDVKFLKEIIDNI